MSSPKPKDKKLYEKTKEKAKKKFKVYPSIYANSWLVAEYKKAYEKKHGSDDAYEGDKPKDSGLPKWFDEEWIDLARSNPEKDKWVQCGRPKAGQKKSDWKKDYPKCLPKAKAKKLWKEGGKEAWDSAVKRKQAAVKKKSYKGGKPTYVSTKAAESEKLKGENNGFFGMRKGLLAEAGIVGSSLFLVGAAMMQYERKGITDKRWWPYIATFFAGASLHLIYEALGLNKKYCETAFDADEVNKLDKEFKKLKPKYDTWRERVDWEGKNPKRPRKDDWKKDIEWEESVKLEADSESKHRIVLLGMPASGKGTQAPKVSERYGVPVLGMGATIRKNMEEKTELGMQSKAFMDAGELVPDELVIGMIDTELQDPKYRKGFVLDGYPRTVPQAERLERITEVDSVIFLTCTEDTVIGRIGGRRSCGGCGAVYHILFNPPKTEGTCDECGSELQRRADDTDEIIRNRIKVFWEKTAPLIDFYESRGLLKPVDANGTPNQVFENVVEALEGKEMVVMGAEEKPTSVEVKRSTNDEKKLMAVFKYPDGKTKTTHFGARGMSDYTKHGDKERMERYLDRHDNGREDWTDPTTAGALSRWILWNKPSLSGSFNDFKKRFKLKGDLKVKKSAESFDYSIGTNNESSKPSLNRDELKMLNMIKASLYRQDRRTGKFLGNADYASVNVDTRGGVYADKRKELKSLYDKGIITIPRIENYHYLSPENFFGMNEDELDRVQNVNIKLNPIAWRYRFHADPRLIARFSWLFDNQGRGLIQRGNQIVKSAENFEADTYEIIIPDGDRVGYNIIKALDKDMIDWEQVEGNFRIINGEEVGYHIIRKLNKAGIDWFPIESFEAQFTPSQELSEYSPEELVQSSAIDGYQPLKYSTVGNRAEENVVFESFRGRWNAGQTRDIEGVRVKKMWNGAFRLDFQGESTIIRDGIFYQINRSRAGRFSMGERDRQLNRELRRTGYSEKDEPDNMEAIIRWKHKIGGGRLVIRSPFKKARHIFAGGLYHFRLPGQSYGGVFYPTNRGKTYRFIRRNGEPMVGRFPKKNEAWLDIRYDAEMSYDSEDTTNTLCNHQLVLGAEHYGDDERPMTCPVCVNQLSSYQSFEADYIKSLRE